MLRLLTPDIVAGTWEAVGPAPLPNGQTEGTVTAVSGRATSIAVHPTTRTSFTSAPRKAASIARSTAATWKATLTRADPRCRRARARPVEPSTVFVGTGEPNFVRLFFGVGVYRIDNADDTRRRWALQPQLLTVERGRADRALHRPKVAVHPTDPTSSLSAPPPASAASACAQAAIGGPRPVPLDQRPRPAPTFQKLAVETVNAGNRSSVDIEFEPGNPNTISPPFRASAPPETGASIARPTRWPRPRLHADALDRDRRHEPCGARWPSTRWAVP